MSNDPHLDAAPRLGPGQIAGLILGIVGLVGVLVYALAFAGGGAPMAKAVAAQRNFSIYEDDHTLGDPKAPITLIEYAAPSCPHCAHFFLSVFPQLKKNYIDSGKVYFVFRAYPLMPADGAVEMVARCQRQVAYFDLIHHIYATQREWDPEYGITNVRDALVRQFAKLGIDEAGVARCLANANVQDRMNMVAQDGELKYGIKGVPTFVLNGEVLENETDIWPKMKAAIDAKLAGR